MEWRDRNEEHNSTGRGAPAGTFLLMEVSIVWVLPWGFNYLSMSVQLEHKNFGIEISYGSHLAKYQWITFFFFFELLSMDNLNI